jgi:hypothetical protein
MVAEVAETGGDTDQAIFWAIGCQMGVQEKNQEISR